MMRWDSGRTNLGDAERTVSTLGGAALLGAAVTQRRWSGLLLLVAGGLLLKRGLTGYCDIKAAFGHDRRQAASRWPDGTPAAEARHPASIVDEASADSFPASDPPAYIGSEAGGPVRD